MNMLAGVISEHSDGGRLNGQKAGENPHRSGAPEVRFTGKAHGGPDWICLQVRSKMRQGSKDVGDCKVDQEDEG